MNLWNYPRNEREFIEVIQAFLAGPWTEDGCVKRASLATGQSFRFIRPFVRRMIAAFPNPTHADRLIHFAKADSKLVAALTEEDDFRVVRKFYPHAVMAPHPSAALWNLPSIRNPTELIDRLRIDAHQLEWLADRAGRNQREKNATLRHYYHNWLTRPTGRPRLLEIPKSILKTIQRRILHLILDRIPPHDAAHGFRAGRSIKTFAEVHAGRAVVLRYDLKAFFPTVSANAILAVFRTAGYPPEIAHYLMALCTTRLPRDVWYARPNAPVDGSDHYEGLQLCDRHLPQGAPSSPALANLAAYRLDCRLHGLAKSVDATYTRYADDLAFSGGEEFRRTTDKFSRCVAKIVDDEGFALNLAKSRVMPQSVRQQIAGVVINIRPNVSRRDFDELKATLTNAIRHGPAPQNRHQHADFRAYLTGKVAHVAMLNPFRARRLYALLDRISWLQQSAVSDPSSAKLGTELADG